VFAFTRTGDKAAPLDVSYELSGTATSGADYAAPAGTLTFPAGKKSVTLNVQHLNDLATEALESVVVRVVPSASSTPASKATATVLITDDDGARK
jgi:hypothetical protein